MSANNETCLLSVKLHRMSLSEKFIGKKVSGSVLKVVFKSQGHFRCKKNKQIKIFDRFLTMVFE